MDVSDMKLIVAIASSGSISKAAQSLRRSQPNLSKELQALENKYNVKLFDRSNTGTKITEAGEVFLNSAKKILSEITTLQNTIENISKAQSEIHIGSVRLFYCLRGIQEWVDSLLEDSHYSIFIHEDSVSEIIEKVATGKYTIGYISVPHNHEDDILRILANLNLDYQQMVTYNKKLLIKRDHPLNKKEVIEIDDLKDYPEIVVGANCLKDNGIDLVNTSKKKIVVNGVGSARDYMNLGKGHYVCFAGPIPSDILDSNNMVIKPFNFKSELMKDFVIFKQRLRNEDITNSFIDTLTTFIKRAVV